MAAGQVTVALLSRERARPGQGKRGSYGSHKPDFSSYMLADGGALTEVGASALRAGLLRPGVAFGSRKLKSGVKGAFRSAMPPHTW
jgi:hypothetical protein